MSETIILINPPAEGSKERKYARTGIPRLGLAYLAAYLQKQGIQPRVIDAKLTGLGFEQILHQIKNDAPALIGITALTPEINDAAKLAIKIKRESPSSSIAIGGAHASALPQRTLEEFPCFDFVVFGEGEITLYQLFLHLMGEGSLEQIGGLAFRQGGESRCNKPRPFIKDPDELPFPAWSLFPPAQKYPVLASRGCPYQCNFCQRILGSRLRLRSPYKVVEEMETVYDAYKPKKFTFHDDTFGVSRKWTHELLDLMIKRGLAQKFEWDITTRVDVMDYELLRKLNAAGCSLIGLGIESGNPEILKSTKKGITLEEVKKAVVLSKKVGLKTAGFFILGHPHETRQTLADTINFAAKLGTTTVAFGIMTPYPGTEIARMAKQGEGGYKLLSENWADYGKQVGNALELEAIPRKELERAQLKGYLKFYLHNLSISRIRELFHALNTRALLSYLTDVLFLKLLLGKSLKRG